MSQYPVPGEWFESVSEDGLYPVDEGYDADDDPRSRVRGGVDGAVDEIRAIASDLASVDDWQNAHRLRILARSIEFDYHELKQVALVELSRPRPEPVPIGEPSPTGNCRKCGRPLELPSMGRGRPRTLCLTCSPSRRR